MSEVDVLDGFSFVAVLCELDLLRVGMVVK
jgi:hypothetical protein